MQSTLLLIYVLVTAALLVAELREDRRAQILFKPLAALGFIILALYCGALDSLYGQIILAGLAACAVGDVLLLSRHSETLFKLGMGAFALGHIAYIGAFMNFGAILERPPIIKALVFAVVTGLAVAHFLWIKPKLPKPMRLPIGVYSAIIAIMVITAFPAGSAGQYPLVLIAAILFAVSDIFVARDRFIAPSPKNALLITPLYFGAQAAFAMSMSLGA